MTDETTAYTAEQLAQMATAWQQARKARYAAFRASLSAEQIELWHVYQQAHSELLRVRTWQERRKRPMSPRPHNLLAPTWPEEKKI